MASTEQGLEDFRKHVSIYEHRVGHICRQVASQIPPLCKDLKFPSEGGKLLDDACGIGAVSEEWLKVYPKTNISAMDITPAMVNAFKAIINESPLLQAQVKDVRVENSQMLSFEDNSFDAAIMNFAIFFMPDPVAGVKEMHRTLKPGGIAAISTWKAFGFRPIWDQVQDYIGPVNRLTELPIMEPWCDSSKLEGVMKEAGFAKPEFHPVKATLWANDVEDFKVALVESFSQFVSMTYSDEEKARVAPMTSKVVDDLVAANDSSVLLRDGDRIGCGGAAWVAVGTK